MSSFFNIDEGHYWDTDDTKDVEINMNVKQSMEQPHTKSELHLMSDSMKMEYLIYGYLREIHDDNVVIPQLIVIKCFDFSPRASDGGFIFGNFVIHNEQIINNNINQNTNDMNKIELIVKSLNNDNIKFAVKVQSYDTIKHIKQIIASKKCINLNYYDIILQQHKDKNNTFDDDYKPILDCMTNGDTIYFSTKYNGKDGKYVMIQSLNDINFKYMLPIKPSVLIKDIKKSIGLKYNIDCNKQILLMSINYNEQILLNDDYKPLSYHHIKFGDKIYYFITSKYSQKQCIFVRTGCKDSDVLSLSINLETDSIHCIHKLIASKINISFDDIYSCELSVYLSDQYETLYLKDNNKTLSHYKIKNGTFMQFSFVLWTDHMQQYHKNDPLNQELQRIIRDNKDKHINQMIKQILKLYINSCIGKNAKYKDQGIKKSQYEQFKKCLDKAKKQQFEKYGTFEELQKNNVIHITLFVTYISELIIQRDDQ